MSTSNSRNIILLLDGTANQFSDKNTNLIKTLSVIRADESQLVYYSSGLGTVLPESTSTWGHIRQKAAQFVDIGVAWNFDEFVCDAYKFLMDYYRTGDKIYLFGFSRGAYTARALAGMIQRVGLLPAGNHNQVTLAYEMYTGPELPRGSTEKDPSVLYRRIFGRSRPVVIEFMGVWDTVSSIGGFDLPQLPFASGAKSIKVFRHALALDERRARFAAEYWRHDRDELDLQQNITKAKTKASTNPSDSAAQQALAAAEKALKDRYPRTVLAGPNGAKKEVDKNVECWFMGCHSDVGGGNTLNNLPALSNIPFRWMLREAVYCGLLLDPEGVAAQTALVVVPTTADVPAANPELSAESSAALARLREMLSIQSHDASCEAEDEEEVEKIRRILTQAELLKVIEADAEADSEAKVLSKDEMAQVNESLHGAWFLLEKIVLKTRTYERDGVREEDEAKVNNGQGRQIVPGQKCHVSVLHRLMHEYNSTSTSKYAGPAAKVAQDWPSWDEVRKGKAVNSKIWIS